MKQIILTSEKNYQDLTNYINENNIDNIFVVCLKRIKTLNLYNYLTNLTNVKVTFFNNFMPNPTYESVVDGVKQFKNSSSNTILAIGGGSAIDVAKCIKLYANMDENQNYLTQKIIPNNINLMAVPTTAGTGSEATKYAVIYYNGEKQSVTDESCIPNIVLFDSSLLQTLPTYQKKATVLDALSHSIESMWSVNSTDESKGYSRQAINLIINNFDKYLNDDIETNQTMLKASNLAGKAINITQTTAGHAMCYKLTSLYKIPHGHAAALINSMLFPYIVKNLDKCTDPRGKDFLLNTFKEISQILGCSSIEEGSKFLYNLLDTLDLYNVVFDYNDIDILTKSVNPTRLKNNPISLNENDIKNIYIELFDEIEKRKINGSKTICKNIKR